MRLEDYQERAVMWLAKRGRGMVVAPAGSGKTWIAAAALERVVLGKERTEVVKVGWMANTLEQCEQARKAIGMFPGLVGTVEPRVECAQAGMDWSDCDVLIVDECFPAGTKVDGTPIECIKVGDRVTTHLGVGSVLHVFKTRAKALCRIYLSNGACLVATPNHPIWTAEGFKSAKRLTSDDMVLSIMPYESMHHLSRARGQPGVREKVVPVGSIASDYCEHVQEAWGTNNPVSQDQRDAPSGSEGLGFHKTEGDGMGSGGALREREAASDSSASPGGGIGVGDGGCDKNRKAERVWLSNLLQGGHWECGFEGGSRGRWIFSLYFNSKGSRQKERRIAEFVRVVGVEVYQSGSGIEFGRLCPEGFVYNLEVSHGNTFVADGVLVHNCHHLPAESWLKQVQSGPRCRWGFTATPWGNDVERNRILREMFDGQVWVVERGEVMARLAPALVRMLDATDEGLGEVMDREIDRELERLKKWSPRPEHELRITTTWQYCVKIGIVGNRARNLAAVEAVRRHAADHVLVLVNEIEHGERLAQEIGAKLCFSKMGRKARREVLAEFTEGRLPCIVATSLADEGLDLPIADVLVLVSGGRSEGKTVQRTGRVLRQFPGKPCGIIYDFLDRQHACMHNHAKSRMRVYRSLGYEVRMPAEQEAML